MDPLHTLVITPALWPLHEGSLGRAVADYIDACHQQGARVSVLTRAPEQRSSGPLARRLDDVLIPTPTTSQSVALWEGPTPSNSAQVWALDSTDWIRTGPVGLRLARRRAPIDAVHAFDGALPALLGVRAHATVATLTELPEAVDDAWATAVESAAAVVVPSVHFAAHPSSRWRVHLAGAKRVVGIGHGARPMESVGDAARERAMLGMPGRYPIAVTHGPIDLRATGELHSLATMPVAWVAVAEPGSPSRAALEELANARPRRIAVVDAADPRAQLARRVADLHVFAAPYGPSPESPLAQARGAVCLCHSSGDFADRIVQWDPSSQTGNGLRFATGELCASLALACGSLSSDALRARARRLSLSWTATAASYIELYRDLALAFAKNWP